MCKATIKDPKDWPIPQILYLGYINLTQVLPDTEEDYEAI